MKVNPTVILTFLLLSMMFGAGALSASLGLELGKAALKEVTQPDVRPNTSGESNSPATGKGQGLKLLKEDEVIKTVKARMSGKEVEPEPAQTKAVEPAADQSAEAKAAEEPKKDERFPIATQDQDVSLEVTGVRRQGSALLLDVSLKNEGSRSVQFLYSFLNVTDDKGRSLSATTEGLPGDLPPSDESYSGTVSIPTALLENAQKLSLTLTDYPDQELELKMSEIPVQ
ncbi:hypothetical protein [Oscillatoria acuminata]|uniref:Uncharacterized protein n=1 Tax=Oscillatoria acuminata PCC 6304 TaxID=56110 RepID=K9TGM5_9CYAN|nr:hypothetical protein [Oscillatoria acuminata]AFY82022.1 hypothetical protein Oscil6304_2398 [Oscillatoria acuminata PCC 6304]